MAMAMAMPRTTRPRDMFCILNKLHAVNVSGALIKTSCKTLREFLNEIHTNVSTMEP